MIAFMSLKPEPFLRNALLSKEHFWEVPAYKRGMTFVFLTRFMLGFSSQRMWKKFTAADLKINTRCFRRWVAKEAEIFPFCDKYNALADTFKLPPRIAKRKPLEPPVSTSDSPVKKNYVVADDSTDEDV